MNYCYICKFFFLRSSVAVANIFVKYVFLPYRNSLGGIEAQKRRKNYVNKHVSVCKNHHKQYSPPKKKEIQKQSMFTKVWQVLKT